MREGPSRAINILIQRHWEDLPESQLEAAGRKRKDFSDYRRTDVALSATRMDCQASSAANGNIEAPFVFCLLC